MNRVLVDDGTLVVRESTDAGAYYCAHLLYALHADIPSSVVAPAAAGPLVGFLHVPPDAMTYAGASTVSAAQRHHRLARVVEAALRGYRVLGASLAEGTFRILLSGFDAFGAVEDNPTGAFVHNLDEVARVCASVFGAPAHVDTEHNVVHCGPNEVHCVRFPVDDRVFTQASEHSLRHHLLRTRPHAILAMGVSRDPAFRVETAPNDRGFDDASGNGVHAAARPASNALPPTLALSMAIALGWAEMTSTGDLAHAPHDIAGKAGTGVDKA